LGRWNRSGDLELQVSSDSGLIVLRGRAARGVLHGTAQIGANRGDLVLVTIASLDSGALARFEGSYLLARDHLVVLARTVFGLSFVDFETGETRAMTPLSDSALSATTTLFGRVPIDFQVELRRDATDAVTGLVIERSNGDVEYARRLTFRHEEVTFRNGDVVLSGTIVLPAGPGPHPALVRTHGSGAATRATPMAEWFAYNGIAFLSYDKRGVGRSTGQWRNASMKDLAQDAVAAVALLKSRADIDSRRIGVSGGSEGAWVAPLAAALSPDVRFLYVGAFSGHSLGESIVWRIQTLLTLDGHFSAQEVASAVALRRLYNEAIVGNRGYDSLRVAIQLGRRERWFAFARVPDSLPVTLDSVALARERHFLDFDPDTAWSRVRVPALFLAGGRDRSAASLETWPRIATALRRAGNNAYTLRVFPTANHEGLEAATGADDEYPVLHRYAPGYFLTLLEWLRATLHLPRR
jgi:alpha-beta hydrolase superfamily lysophospholipase